MKPIASPPPPLNDSGWLLEVDGEPIRMELTFRGGQTFEVGMPVGVYESIGRTFIATIGEHVRLIVALADGLTVPLAARMLTKAQDATLDERALLYGVGWN
jgi:hypothetical protein